MKLFITDFDGTLYTDDSNIKINRRKILELHKLGFIIIISTGRCFESIKKQVKKYDLYYDYLHCADGSIIYDNNDKLIKFSEIEHDIIVKIISLKEKYNVEDLQISYPREYKNIYNKHDKIAGINMVVKSELIEKELIDEFFKLKENYPNYNFLFYDHGDYAYFCIKKKDVSKAYAIKYMQELFNIKKEDIYVIGDSYNDLEMIEKYNGCSILGNDDINKKSKKVYHHLYEYINEIKEDLSITI